MSACFGRLERTNNKKSLREQAFLYVLYGRFGY